MIERCKHCNAIIGTGHEWNCRLWSEEPDYPDEFAIPDPWDADRAEDAETARRIGRSRSRMILGYYIRSHFCIVSARLHRSNQRERQDMTGRARSSPGQPTAVARYDPRDAMLRADTDSWVAVVREVSKLAGRSARREMVPAPLCGRGRMSGSTTASTDFAPAAARVAAVMLHGRELGLPPMTALAMTHVIEGRVASSAEAQRGLVLQAGHEIEFVEIDVGAVRHPRPPEA